MPVIEVKDEPLVEPNHIYVIPPDRSMFIKGGHLKLAPRGDKSNKFRTIDGFLRSLADDQSHRAIGVGYVEGPAGGRSRRADPHRPRGHRAG